MRKTTFILAFLLLTSGAAFAGGTGGYAAAFLQIPVYPRAVAMGNAFAALADDPSAIFWNPAGLSELERKSLMVSTSKLTLDRIHSFGVLAVPFGEAYNCVAIAFDNFTVKHIDKRDASGNQIGEFNDSESSISLALATSFFASEDENVIIDLGFSPKFIMHYLDDASATGFSMDIGLIADFYRTYRFGIVLYDPFGKLWWSTGTSEPLPQRMRLGMALAPRGLPFRFTADLDYNLKGEGWSYFAGGELTLAGVLSLRAGYSSKTAAPAFGLGLRLAGISLDYSFSKDQLDTHPLHHAGLIFRF